MNMGSLVGKVFGFLTIIVTLALAPSINTANATVAAANLTNCIGMSVVTEFGAPLIVIGLLLVGGLFALGKIQASTIRELMGVIFAVIVAIVGLTFMEDIVTYTNTLIAASTGFAVTLYGIIPLAVYLLIIGDATYATVRRWRGGKKGKKAAAAANY